MDEAFFLLYIAPYLLGVSQNALVGAITARLQQRDAGQKDAESTAKTAQERAKSLIQKIEEKMLSTLSSLPSDEDAAKLLVKEVGDSVFLNVLGNQIMQCNFESDAFLDSWVTARPELEPQRNAFAPFVTHFLDAVAAAIAGDNELTNLINLKILGRIYDNTSHVQQGALMPPTAPVPPATIPPLEVLKKACITTSQALLAWPKDINGYRIESPIFSELVKPLLPEQANVRILIGEPGSGKSALLAQVADWFLKQGYLVLAIKADLLPHSVDSVAKLGTHFGLGGQPVQAIEFLSKTGPLVVLIDQLDALAGLVDVHGGRLNALMQLIRELGALKTFPVIASSREVEFKHDARLCVFLRVSYEWAFQEASKMPLLWPVGLQRYLLPAETVQIV